MTDDYRTATTAELAEHDRRVLAAQDARAEPAAILGFIHRIDGHTDVLDRTLTRWAARHADDSGAHSREAANTAMETIAAMLRELHTLHGALGSEIRAFDGETVRRADEILASALAAAQAPADPEAWAYR